MSANISRDEWLKAVGDAVQPCDPTAITVKELAETLGVSDTIAYRHIKRLMKEGKAIVTRKRIPNAAGHPRTVSAYKLVTHAARPATRRR